MSHVLAAIDNDLAARPVIDIAIRLGQLLDVPVEAIHVSEDGASTARALADAAGVHLRVVDGDPPRSIINQFAAPDVVLGVVGARGFPSGRRPAGTTALAIAQATNTPLAVVPPDCELLAPSERTHILVPLDGTLESSAAARKASLLFKGANIEVMALHVFDATTVPRFWDQPHHAATSWRHEFAARHLEHSDSPLEVRTGPPGARVVEVAAELHADFIALCWSQDLSPGRAQTLRDVLANSPAPVVLFPLSDTRSAPEAQLEGWSEAIDAG